MTDFLMTAGAVGPYAVVDPLSPSYVEAFWASVDKALTNVFGLSGEAAVGAVQEIKSRLDAASPTTRMHFFHLEPLQVAADFLGAGELTTEQAWSYVRARNGGGGDHPARPDLERHAQRVRTTA